MTLPLASGAAPSILYVPDEATMKRLRITTL
jgi:hypothetical protein